MLGRGSDDEPPPGATQGLPGAGAGSHPPWGSRLTALLIDWGACMVFAVGAFGVPVLTGQGWRSWTILATYFVQKTILTALTGSSFGQLFTRVGVVRLDGRPLGWWRSAVRAALVCLVLPAVVVGAERRGLDDLLLKTVVVNRR